MVKALDENESLPDHVGWLLWQANRLWMQDFVAAVREAGHPWFSEARASLIGQIPRGGARQLQLIERLGTSKQAVQQLLDGLEAEGVIVRLPDPADKRGRLVRYTDKGQAALRDADRAKVAIENRYAERLGRERLSALLDALRALNSEN
ncbi:MAG: winged helix-turn-helix transcriptional regulator [Rhizobiaceae bacterium]|nr:winged helix-turn-helix transcriptional regulator [Rhizobiaceae bacterium]